MSGENSTGIKKTDEKRPDEGIARRSFLTGAGAAALPSWPLPQAASSNTAPHRAPREMELKRVMALPFC